jgi:hypothetical protein
LQDKSSTLNPSQRQRLLVTCRHIDKLLCDIEDTLNTAASKTVFPNYIGDITPQQHKAIDDDIARIRAQLLEVLAGQSLAPEKPRISAAHSVDVNLTFVEIAIAELAPHYMRGYGPVSTDAAADLREIAEKLQSGVKELHRYVSETHPDQSEPVAPSHDAITSSS